MASVSYSFIDIAVLEPVRARFAAGDALAILSVSLDEIVWVNGPGAAMLGYPDIDAAIGAGPGLSTTAGRQIAATPGFPDIGHERTITVRVARGVSSSIVAFQASAVILPDGEKAILLALPASSHLKDDEARAEAAVQGFGEPGQFAALIDAEGNVAAAARSFAALDIAPETLHGLVEEVRGEADRLVKRRIAAGGGRQLPAGFARLTDEPAMHLLVVVDEGDAAPAETADAAHVSAEAEGEIARIPESEAEADDTEAATGTTPQPTAANDPAPSDAAEPGDVERAEATPAAADTNGPARAPAPRLEGTVRFAWRTDEQSRFTALSDAFVEAVGAAAADVIGRSFRDVSNAFGLDPQGRIPALLERRDTWSGRTVMWPVAGTDRKVPVDLAALPIYGRGRVFEGFHGFGLARLGDAVADPEGIGLVLTEPASGAAAREDEHAPFERPGDEAASEIETGPPAEPEPDHAPETAAGEAETAAPFLAISATSEPAARDKVVELRARETEAPRYGLSPGEQTAFREIGERLRRDSGEKDADTAAEAVPGTEAGTSAARPAPADEEADNTGAQAGAAVEDETPDTEAETQADAPAPGDAQADDAAREDNGETPEADAAGPVAMPGPAPEATAPDGDKEADRSEQASKAENEPTEASTGETPPDPVFLPSAFAGAAPEPADAGVDTTVLAHLPLPILIHSGDALHYANRAFFEFTGHHSLSELEREGGIDALFVDPYSDDASAAAASARHVRLRTAEGTEFDAEAHLQSVPWDGGRALLLALKTADPRDGETSESAADAALAALHPAVVDARSDAETAELQMHLAEMRAIIDTATDGVAIIANDGTIRSTNKPAEALFGFEGQSAVGKPFTSLFAIESQRAVQEHLNGLSDNGVASVLNDGLEVIGREAQGRFIPLFMTIGRLPNESGFCAVLRDVTQWKRAEEELTKARAEAEHASSQKTEFLARVSHEIRTPLNAIIGFSELIVDEKFGPIGNERYRDYLRDINQSGSHVLDLVNDLLDISKIEAGQQEMHYEALPLNEVLGQTVAMMQPQANRERVIIRSSFASNLPDVVADPRSVRQIALNLLSNAVRYTPAGGQVIVSTAYSSDGSVVMRVRDTGVGMSTAEIDEALKPFKQINTLRRKRGDGTGLGLPLTRAMVEANRAQFTINSVPGEGTLVEVSFPSTRVLAD